MPSFDSTSTTIIPRRFASPKTLLHASASGAGCPGGARCGFQASAIEGPRLQEFEVNS